MDKDFTVTRILELCNIPRSIDYITHHLHGTDPMTLGILLSNMEKNELIRKQNDDYWLSEEKARIQFNEVIDLNAPPFIKRFLGQFNIFKKPHPLDFEWRNSPKTVKYLTESAIDLSNYDKTILILGMPTLFANLCEKPLIKKMAIVEKNKAVTNTLKIIAGRNNIVFEEDIFQVSPDVIGKFDIVVMDPPWYNVQFKQFVWLASQCLNLGGKLLISIPSYNTRPGIMAERIDWFKFCEQLGLCIESLQCNTLEYSTPFFEFNAQRVAGVQIGAFWRHGDFLTFCKLENRIISRPVDEKEKTEDWHEVEINEVRIRIDTFHEDEEGELAIESIVNSDDVLPTVSARDERRRTANVWTSGNRIFHTNKPARLFGLLNLMKENVSDSSVDFSNCEERFLIILDKEKQEYDWYVKWFFCEVERDFSQIF